MDNLNKDEKLPKIAFVASGGAVKAACFHLGVSLALQEQGFKFQGGSAKSPRYEAGTKNLISTYVGSSAGAIITSLLATGYASEEILYAFANKQQEKTRLKKINYWQMFHLGLPIISTSRKILKKKHVISASSGLESMFRNYLTLTGLASTKGIEEYLNKYLPLNKFNDLASNLFVVATQVNHAKRTIFGKKEALNLLTEKDTCHYTDEVLISRAVAASAALPPFYRPFSIKYSDGNKIDYFDGEIRKTLSTHVAKDIGANIIFASYTHQPYNFTKEIGSLADYGMTSIITQALYQTIEQKISTTKRFHKKIENVLETVNRFFKENDLPDEKRKSILALMEKSLDHRRNVQYIYIHPQPHNYEMFFGDHFNLSPKVMEVQMRVGFRSAINALKSHGLYK